MDAVEPDAFHIIDGGGQADHTFDVRRAGLETAGRRGISRLLERHRFDHGAAALPRRHGGENLGPRPQHADAGRAIQLVAGQHIEIAIERRHVEREARRGLAAIDHEQCTGGVGGIGDAAHIGNAAEHVGDMGDADQPGFRPDHGDERIFIDAAIVGERRDVEHGAAAFAQHLPRHDIAVMLKCGNQDAVAGLEALAPTLGDQVDAFSGAAHEHDFVRRCGADEAGDSGAGFLEAQRHGGGAFVHTAMHGGIIRAIDAGDGVDHRLRLLRGRRRVEIGPIAGKPGEIALQIEQGRRGGHGHAAVSSNDVISASSASVVASSRPSSASERKARVSRARAWAGGTPRLVM